VTCVQFPKERRSPERTGADVEDEADERIELVLDERLTHASR